MDEDFREPHLRGEDFLGVFGVLRRRGSILLCQNRRRIGGTDVLTWDLPGGQVEPGELMREALVRELREELAIDADGATTFLFVQEGERVRAGRRWHAWRSVFFECAGWRGEPRPCSEVLDVRWFEPHELAGVLTAPYHDSFSRWLAEGGRYYASRWVE